MPFGGRYAEAIWDLEVVSVTANQVIAIAEVAAVLIAGGGIYMTLRGLRDQLWLTTFAEYTRRYSEITRMLPADSREPGASFEIEALPRDERGRVVNAVRDYLNLCSEEFYLHSRKRIDDETWRIWELGIAETVRLPWIQETWASVKREYSYYPSFCEFVDHLVPDDSARRVGERT
jgi:hypothetical protein